MLFFAMKYLINLFLLLFVTRCMGQDSASHTIAILPFKVTLYNIEENNDTTWQALRNREIRFGVDMQARLYDTLTQHGGLRVNIQPWRVTDSLLVAAGADFSKINFLDMHAICRLLHVDAVMKCAFIQFPKNGKIPGSVEQGPSYTDPATGMTFTDVRKVYKAVYIALMDEGQEDPFWYFSEQLDRGEADIKGLLNIGKENYKVELGVGTLREFIRKFPLISK